MRIRMYPSALLAVLAAVVLSGPAVGQSPGKEPRGAQQTPPDKSAAGESEKTPETKLTPKRGGRAKTFAPVEVVHYMLGVKGYAARTGVVVVSTVWSKDLDQKGKVRSPANEFDVDLKGDGKLSKVRLEPGDRITAIAGYQVRTMHELTAAVNSAPDPHRIEITFVDHRTGKEHSGFINAMRVK